VKCLLVSYLLLEEGIGFVWCDYVEIQRRIDDGKPK